ncbi:MAG: hypothetical protein Ct9H300mP1_11480 [Planctomycetaceae bacterium]|nr:MAG: hypothetical protein Ct9H300mP1_11480 [Planctomycetaceae bacterium]
MRIVRTLRVRCRVGPCHRDPVRRIRRPDSAGCGRSGRAGLRRGRTERPGHAVPRGWKLTTGGETRCDGRSRRHLEIAHLRRNRYGSRTRGPVPDTSSQSPQHRSISCWSCACGSHRCRRHREWPPHPRRSFRNNRTSRHRMSGCSSFPGWLRPRPGHPAGCRRPAGWFPRCRQPPQRSGKDRAAREDSTGTREDGL